MILHAHEDHSYQLDAVIVRDLVYEAGRGRGKKLILNQINLTVPEGSIYGLLGPSGCGKTTMLRCIVGRLRVRSGSVLVFGCQPGQSPSEIPGRDVGYMPQEISIYEDFTIEETLKYFGKINRMRTVDIHKRIEFLLQFLDLPSKKRLVANLSGGQKRRVSLAAALVHSPPLLILDEPTVGVDPLLRQSIWRHLVTLTQTERISVIITTHYIEEARQANVVGLMRHGKILAENSPDELMHEHGMSSLEDVFLKLCVTDSSRHAATLAVGSAVTTPSASSSSGSAAIKPGSLLMADSSKRSPNAKRAKGRGHRKRRESAQVDENTQSGEDAEGILRQQSRWAETEMRTDKETEKKSSVMVVMKPAESQDEMETRHGKASRQPSGDILKKGAIRIHTATNKIEMPPLKQHDPATSGFTNVAVEVLSSESDTLGADDSEPSQSRRTKRTKPHANYRNLMKQASHPGQARGHHRPVSSTSDSQESLQTTTDATTNSTDNYVAIQAIKWAARRTNAINMMNLRLGRAYGGAGIAPLNKGYQRARGSRGDFVGQWWRTLMAVTWKNYIRLRRNPPVLVFQFMLPAIQVFLFCLCIGGEPFDVPVAVVNDELDPKASRQFLNGLNRKIIRQIKYDNLTSAIEAVKRGTVWGAIHIPDRYSQNLQSRLIMGEEVTNETIANGTIRLYPDLTNLHLAMALENTFRETFMNFARDALEEMGYERTLADLPIQVARPIYGSLDKDGYLEFMAPGVVISISYVMATGLTALAFILERRDGLLERSLISGVQTSQILLAHAINQVVVMVIQIFLVLGCTFFVFEIPSRGPFFWVVLLILLQGCTGMGFGLLVSAVCKEENTAVMMLVGTFYTNLILAGIIWPIEAMPHWLRPLSYAQPQTLPTDTLRHILSRGWGITEAGVLLGFAVTIGWLVIFLISAGLIFKYWR